MTDLGRRRTSFGSVAAVYERGRPGYPGEAVAWLAERLRIEPGRDVLDLGAGTGKLTRQLVLLGARVVAVEPLDEMRAELIRVVPESVPLAGAAEAIPLDDGSVDAVTCAQAFHWFDAGVALPEIWRVLRPGGALGLIWNTRDASDSLHAEVSAIVGEDAAFNHDGTPPEIVTRCGLFGDPERLSCDFEQMLSRTEFVERVASMSIVAARERRERDQVVARIEAVAARSAEPIPLTYVTEAFAFRRRD